MGVEAATYQTLSNATALTALVDTRIYPEHRPATVGTLPAVVFFRSPGGERINSLAGYEQLENSIIEIEVYSTAIDSRRQVSDQVIEAMTTSTYFSCILPDSPYDDYDDESGTYERTMDFSVWNTTT